MVERKNLMNKYLKNLNRIEFVVTMACTGKCKHCSQGEHKTSENIDKVLAADAVRRIAEEYKIESVMTFGGEPLLFYETVCEIHKAARDMNIPQRQLITNGYFSKDTDKIKLVAEKLIKSGVNEILISVDAFHQETIPLEYVKTFAKAIIETDVKIQVHPAWLVSAEDDNLYNNKTREILKEFVQMGIETSEGNVIYPSGNALKYFAEYFDLSKKEKNPYQEDPENIRAICFSANGDVLGGNIYKQDIREVLANYANIVIEPLNPEDYHKCSNIWNMKSQPLADKWYNEIVSGNRIVYIYKINGEFIGEGALVFNTGDADYTIPNKRVYVSRMIVKKEYRNRGIGGEILKFIIAKAKAMGYSEMTIGVDKDNTNALKLYRKNGFDEVIFEGADKDGEYYKLMKRM